MRGGGSENLCRLGRAPELARLLKDRCKEHVSVTLKPQLVELAHEKDTVVLRAVIEAWSRWMREVVCVNSCFLLIDMHADKRCQNTIQGIFFYLDRAHLLQIRSATIREFCISQFRTHVFGDPALRGKIVEGACDLLLADRRGNGSSTAAFAESVKMFHELQVYTSDFEPRMLALSQDFILTWSDRECSEKELPDYVSAAVKLMKSEMDRCAEFDLDQSTRVSLSTLLDDLIVQRKEKELSEYQLLSLNLDPLIDSL